MPQGNLLTIPISKLDKDSFYLVIARVDTNYDGGSGDFVIDVSANGSTGLHAGESVTTTWNKSLTVADIVKPNPQAGFVLSAQMNGHYTSGNRPPVLTAVRLSY